MHTHNEAVAAFTAAHCTYYPAFQYIYIYIYLATLSGDKVDYVGVTAGVMLLVLLTFLGFIAAIATGVALRRRALKKRKHPEGNGETQERSGIVELGGATVEEEGTEVHTYDVVSHDTSVDGRAVLYQGLDVGTLDYVSEYTELRGGTYQELDLKGREEEHHYQRVT